MTEYKDRIRLKLKYIPTRYMLENNIVRIAAGILMIIGGVLLYTIMRAFGFGGFLGTFLMIALAAGGVIVMRKKR